MKLTNKNNLDGVFCSNMEHYMNKRMVDISDLNAEYSVTQLLSPLTIAVLFKRHKDEISKDVSDCLYLLQGLVVHQLMENSVYDGKIPITKKVENQILDSLSKIKDNYPDISKDIMRALKDTGLFCDESEDLLLEKPLVIELNGVRISGIPDVYDKKTKTLLDYKHPGIKSAERNMQSYFMQTNIYRYMLQKNGYPVDKIDIVLFYRDWAKAKTLSEINYPKSAIETVNVPIMSDKEVHDFLYERINTIKAYESEHILPPCTEEERFQDPIKYAVVRPGNKKASKICSSQEEAISYIEGKGWKNAYTEIRESEPKRCISYCDVNTFCDFYHDYMRKRQEKNQPF